MLCHWDRRSEVHRENVWLGLLIVAYIHLPSSAGALLEHEDDASPTKESTGWTEGSVCPVPRLRGLTGGEFDVASPEKVTVRCW